MDVQKTTQRKPTVGAVFCPVGNGTTWKLTDIKVTSSINNKFMVPVTEYVQVIDTTDTHVSARYTYITEGYLRAIFKTAWDDAYLSRIGWWVWEQGTAAAWKTKIQSPDYATYMIGDEVQFTVGTALLGNFTGGNGLQFVCAGEVSQLTTAYVAGTERKSFLLNYIPRAVDLTELTVDSTLANKFMVPVTEYIQILDTTDTHVTARYTYITEGYLRAIFKTAWDDAYLSRIGWWVWEQGTAAAWKTKIQSPDYATYMVSSGDVAFEPGEGFLCNFTGGNGLRINFPAAITPAE